MELTLALIVTLITLLSTIFSTVITKYSDLKMKKMDIKFNLMNSNYANSLEVFQNFVSHSSSLLDKINAGLKPDENEINQFDQSCVACLLFLDEDSRQLFQSFRIEVKIKLGYSDPREIDVLNTMANLSSLYKRATVVKPENPLYSLFNKCLNIASKRIESITTDMKDIY